IFGTGARSMLGDQCPPRKPYGYKFSSSKRLGAPRSRRGPPSVSEAGWPALVLARQRESNATTTEHATGSGRGWGRAVPCANPVGGRGTDMRVARGCAAQAAALFSVGAVLARPLAAQCPDGSPPPCRAVRTDPGRQPGVASNSVAVLYFDNLSPDTADAYLADGLTEELILRLGRVQRLAVKSRNAVQSFRGRAAKDPSVLGDSLRVA